jgi:co-chaperonin GroES (HSP10)
MRIFGDRFLVELSKDEKKDLFLQYEHRETYSRKNRGTVVAVGEGVSAEFGIGVGDEILFVENGAFCVEMSDTQLVVDRLAVIAKIEKEKK